ncbi:hypothetical protein Bca101_038320 [Brassica carinata]
MNKMKVGIRAGRRPIPELTKIQPVYHRRRTPVDKDSVTTCGEELEEVKRTRLTETSGGSGGSSGLTGGVSIGRCLFRTGSERGLGCKREGRAVTIIFKEEEQCCIKPRNDGSGGSRGGRTHDGGIVTIMAMKRSRAVSERGGKSGVVGARNIHRNGALGCGLERVSL